jgi:hypothetical protein
MTIKVAVHIPEEEKDKIVFNKSVMGFWLIEGAILTVEIDGFEYRFDESDEESLVDKTPLCKCPDLGEQDDFYCVTHEVETIQGSDKK